MGRMSKTIVVFELMAFGVVIAMLWLNEILDCPHLLFGAPATPTNWVESIFETALVLVLCVAVTGLSWMSLKRIKYLEGFLPICAACKRVRAGTKWVPLEHYVRDHSEADFTHGMCPECIEKHYGDAVVNDR